MHRRTIRTLATFVVAAIVVAGCGAGDADPPGTSDGGDAAGPPRTLRTLWSVPVTRQEQTAHGSWLSGSVVVRGTTSGIEAFDLSSGKQAWRLPMPAGTRLCTMSRTVSDGVGAFSFGPPKRCDRVAVVDMGTGKLRWQVKIPASREDSPPPTTATPSIASGMVVVAETFQILGYRVGDGELRWRYTERREALCLLEGDAVGDRTLIGVKCDDSHLTALDTRTGRKQWQTPLSDDKLPRVISAQPGVALQYSGAPRTLVLVSDAGKVTAVPADGLTEEGLVTAGGTLYGSVHHIEGGRKQYSSDITATDMATGKRRWKRGTGAGHMLATIRADEGGVLAMDFVEGALTRLLRFAAATGKTRHVATLPASAKPLFNVVYERDGHYYIVRHGGTDDGPAVMAVG